MEELRKLRVAFDSQHDVSWCDALFLLGVAQILFELSLCELDDFFGEILEHCRSVDWHSRADSISEATVLAKFADLAVGKLGVDFFSRCSELDFGFLSCACGVDFLHPNNKL